MKNFIAVFLGGCLGGLIRAGIASLASPLLAVTIVNLIGAGLLASLTSRWLQHRLPAWLGLGLGTGFCGSLTTFGTLIMALMHANLPMAILYLGLNVVGGVLIGWLVYTGGRHHV
ncbi:fluoride efflux transporter FluC [Limosilactobacillus equigenerosi]|uniref:Fluoride-specific ion channel FluC n=1 Tax=Limosilactobacillus equigenerosi DSM 18793 = JCM 14505 TaxID=1423742 RepID=A0A0R1UZ49_9LACO|nr:CrcB family protein [Limosilactobacillus equigenerosi]KRL96376.1 hypothetical protein FC21_GL000175 [Limosilactobacillus equigenerosi DSM 18793 = JCM 14505]